MSGITYLSINIFNSLQEGVRSLGSSLISYFPKNSSISMTALKVCALSLFGVVVGLGCRWMLSRKPEKTKIEIFREAFEAKFPAKMQANAEESWNTFFELLGPKGPRFLLQRSF